MLKEKIRLKLHLTLIIIVILILLFVNIINAQIIEDVTASRDIQKQIRYGNQLKITLTVTNNLKSKKTFLLSERLPLNVDLINPKEPSEVKMFNAVAVSFLTWTLDLNPNEKKTVSYIIKPNKIGEYTIVASEITDLATENTYNGLQSEFNVLCTPDNTCNLEIGENYQTCPSDCATGLEDGICNAILDNQCDPDCTKDPDCKGSGFNILYIIIPVFIICLIVMLFYFLKKPKQGIPDTEQQKQDQQPQQPKKPESILYS